MFLRNPNHPVQTPGYRPEHITNFVLSTTNSMLEHKYRASLPSRLHLSLVHANKIPYTVNCSHGTYAHKNVLNFEKLCFWKL